MTQRDMAGYLGITPMTLRNWRKEKPNLYRIIMQGFALEDVKKRLQETLDDVNHLSTREICNNKLCNFGEMPITKICNQTQCNS